MRRLAVGTDIGTTAANRLRSTLAALWAAERHDALETGQRAVTDLHRGATGYVLAWGASWIVHDAAL